MRRLQGTACQRASSICGNGSSASRPLPPDSGRPEMVFCTDDTYDFVKAAEALKDAGIPIYGEEEYTDEVKVGRRFPSPFRWTIFVDESRAEDARNTLAAKEMDFILDEQTYGSSDEEDAGEIDEERVKVTGKPNPRTPVRRPAQSQIVIAGDGSFRKFILLVLACTVIGAVIMLLKK